MIFVQKHLIPLKIFPLERYINPCATLYGKDFPALMLMEMRELLSKILFRKSAPLILLSRSLPSGSFFALFICPSATPSTAAWTNGRLASYKGATFTYDGQGRRASKGSVTYMYDSQSRLIKQSNGLEYYYDRSGVCGVKYNDNTYVYRKDIQGNICAILDNTGNVVVEYKYDAWGNHAVLDANGADITSTTHIGNLNPFRYRGYYYDTETGLYYLKSRYYDPETGRFITIDDISYLDPETINGLNLYAYCGNNPVMNVDLDGHEWWKFWEWDWAKIGMIALSVVEVIAGIAVIVISHGSAIGYGLGLIGTGISSVIGGVLNESNGGTFLAGWAGGQVGGLISTFIPGIGSAIGAFVSSIITDAIDGKDINWGNAWLSAGIGFLLGIPSGVFSDVAAEAGKDIILQIVNGGNASLISLIGTIIDLIRGRKNG